MNLDLSPFDSVATRIPLVSGDEPIQSDPDHGADQYSPRERG